MIKNIKSSGRFLAMAAGFLAAVFASVSAPQASAYTYSSTVVSPVKAYFVPVSFGTISWTNVAAENSSVSLEIRAGNTDSPDDGSWSAWTSVANGGSLAFLGTKSRAQTRVIFSYDATDPNVVPGVSDITVSTYSGEMISSIYDTRNAKNKLTGIAWTATTPGSSHAYFQVRTSRNATEWSSWCGPDNGGAGCDSTTYFSDASGGQSMDADFSSRASEPFFNDDRYVQYRMLAVGDGANVPRVSGVSLSYDRSAETTTVTSPVKDTGSISAFSTISWTQTVPEDTSAAFSVRAGNTATPDGSWSAWRSVVSGEDISNFTGNRYFQYQVVLSSYDVDAMPSVSDVTIPYVQYRAGSFLLLSSPYDTSSGRNLLSRIAWNQTLPTGTLVKFQLRTAPDLAGAPDWTNGSKWCGPTSCAATSGNSDFASDFYQTASGQTTNSVHYDGTGDQWMQYAVWVSNENSGATPGLSGVTLTYVVNAPPIVQNVTAVPSSNKTVAITYEVKDSDAQQGTITPRIITPSFEYYDGSQWRPIAANALGSDDTKNKDVKEQTYTSYDAIWTPSLSSNMLYLTNAKIRVTANDNEAANNRTTGESNVFTLDTKIPANPSLVVDASTQNLADSQTVSSITLGISDDSSVQMKLSLLSDLSDASWKPFNASETIKLETDPDIVYAKFKDQYGNESETISTQTVETPVKFMTQDTSNMLLTPPSIVSFWDLKKPTNLHTASVNIVFIAKGTAVLFLC